MSSNQLLASKIVVQEEAPSLRGIPTLDTAVFGAVGVTEKGPVNTATLVQSFTQFVKIFGSYISASDLCSAVEGFFENGGSNLWVVRVVHYTTITDRTTHTSTKATVTLDDRAGTSLATLRVDGKYDGTYAADLSVKVSAPTSGETGFFNFEVLDSSGLSLEIYPNVTMDDADPRYIVDVVNDADNGSSRIAVADLNSVTVAPNNSPALATTSLAGGNDGLASLADADYVGSASSSTGLRALDTVDDLTLLAVPGVATSGVHNAMITYAEVTRGGQVFAVLDSPANDSASAIITYVTSTAAIAGLSEYAAIYWPRIKVLNPNATVFGKGETITVPPSGHICGMFARNDSAKQFGVFTPPAGTEEGKLFGCVGFETDEVLKEEVRDLVFPKRINPITTMKGFPRFVDGARTLKGDGNWPTIGQRRGVSFTERSLKLGLQFARHKNNMPELRAGLARTSYAFLKAETDAGCFASKDPALAFFVDFGDALNPATTPNIVTGRFGLATAEPAEFIVLKFSQDTRAIDNALKG